MYAALVLLAITLVVNVVGTAIVARAAQQLKAIGVSRSSTQPFDDVDLGTLDVSLRSLRTLLSAVLSGGAIAASLVACVPLFSVLYDADLPRRRAGSAGRR